jgi:nucleotide-binding universal stress UspA family protein
MKILLFVEPTLRGEWAQTLAQDLAHGLGGSVLLLTTRENLEHDPGLLERAEKNFRQSPGLIIEKKVRPGPPREAIVAESLESNPAITVFPPAGRKGLVRIFKGSRVKAVVHNAPSTVMVARKPVSEHIHHILVTVSGGPMAETTVLSAQEVAQALQAGLTVLHVQSDVSIAFKGKETQPSLDTISKLRALLAKAGIKELIVREGLVVNEILTECNKGEYDLLILGQHLVERETGGPFSENLAETLAVECPLPVLVVRPRRWTSGAPSATQTPER